MSDQAIEESERLLAPYLASVAAGPKPVGAA